MFLFGMSCSVFLMLISTLFFSSSRETAVLLQVMFRLSFVLNVPILFSTIGCKISTASFLMFIACVCNDFRLVGFFKTSKLHVRLIFYMLIHTYELDRGVHQFTCGSRCRSRAIGCNSKEIQPITHHPEKTESRGRNC